MMVVLIQCVLPSTVHHSPDRNVYRLEGVSDPKKKAPNGETIEGRMQGLCDDVAEDIKLCGNTCNAYLKFVPVAYHLPILNCESGRRHLQRFSMGLHGASASWGSLKFSRRGGKNSHLRFRSTPPLQSAK